MGYENWYGYYNPSAPFPNKGVNTDNVFTYQRSENYKETAGFGELPGMLAIDCI